MSDRIFIGVAWPYANGPLHLGHRQTISAPYIVGSMTELLELEADDRVLEIGTGCGYQTAVLCEIAREVYSIEIVPELAAFAADNLAALGYAPALRVGDGYAGWPEQAPFNACIVAATAASLPPPLLEQLAPGGRLVAPVLGDDGREWMMRYRRTPSGIQSEALYAVRFVPLTRASRD